MLSSKNVLRLFFSRRRSSQQVSRCFSSEIPTALEPSTIKKTKSDSIVIYDSPKPKSVLGIAQILAGQSIVSAGFSSYWLSEPFLKAKSLEGLKETFLQLPDIFFTQVFVSSSVALVSYALARGIANRVVTHIEVKKSLLPPTEASVSLNRFEQNKDDDITIVRPNIFRGYTTVIHKRGDLLCSPPKAKMQMFQCRENGRYRNQIIFPVVPAWYSDDIHYLRCLIYGDVIDSNERQTPPDSEEIRIEGFGSYRPAQFADPVAFNHVDASRLPDGPIPNTPFFVKKGEVRAEFITPKMTLEDARQIERERSVFGSSPHAAAFVARTAAPASLAIDGSDKQEDILDAVRNVAFQIANKTSNKQANMADNAKIELASSTASIADSSSISEGTKDVEKK